MRVHRLAVIVGIIVAAATMGGCAQSPAIAPVVMDVGDLSGKTVDLVVGQVLDIDTGDLAVDSYSGKVADPAVAKFTPGRDGGGSTTNPGVTGLAEGKTEVVLSNSDGGIQDVTFTVDVTSH